MMNIVSLRPDSKQVCSVLPLHLIYVAAEGSPQMIYSVSSSQNLC